MLIDWFTVASQLVNFAILAWLLKRFLYKPILDAIDAREARIADELANAKTVQAEADRQRADFERKNDEIERERNDLLSKAVADANAERQRLLDEARAASTAMRADWEAALERTRENLNQELARRTREEVFAIARKALADLSGASLEERICEVFTHRLRTLDGSVKAEVVAALRSASGPALVRSAFELPPAQRAAIREAIHETFTAEIEVSFETAPDVIAGIEFTFRGRRVGWSIAEYLTSLQRRVDDLLQTSALARRPGESPATTETAEAQ